MLSARKKADEIHPGSRAELLYVTKELSLSSARSRIERLIDRREYASSEIRRKLREDGYHSDVIDQCVKRACEAGLVSDQRFADSFIRSKVYSGWGMARIARELSRRGIEADTLPGWPYEYLDPEDELSRAEDLARTRRVYGPRAYEKLVRHLCGKGFSMSVATKAASQVLGEREAYED
jgi:regulatory protein